MYREDALLSMVSAFVDSGEWLALILRGIGVVALKTTLLVGLTLAICTALHRRPAALRHCAWLACFVALALAPLVSIGAYWVPAVQLRVPLLPATEATHSPSSTGTALVAAPRAAETARPFHRAAPEPAGSDPSGKTSSRRYSLLSTTWLWLGGLAFGLARVFAGLIGARQIISRSEEVGDSSWLHRWNKSRRLLGIDGPIRLLRSEAVALPMTCGLRRFTVLLPSEADEYSEAQRDSVLLHELAHVRRRDSATHLVVEAITGLYWWHPLVWLARRRVRVEAERAADDLVLNAGTAPADYARDLLNLARSIASPGLTVLGGVSMAHKNRFEERLLAIIDPTLSRARSSRLLAVTLATGLLLVAAGISVVTLTRRAQASPRPYWTATQERTALEPPSAPRPSASFVGLAEPPAPHAPAPSPAASAPSEVQEPPAAGPPQDPVQPAEPAEPSPAAQDPDDDSVEVDPVILDAFLKATKDSDIDVREQAIRASVQAEDPRIAPVLADSLADPEPSIRELSAWGLGVLEHEDSLQDLIGVLASDESAQVREQAAWALGGLEHREATPALAKALTEDVSPSVRKQSAWALGRVGGPDAAPVLAAALDADANTSVSEQAAWALGNIRDARAVPSLLRALTHAETNVREQAAWALGENRAAEAVDGLILTLNDDAPGPRAQAAWALGNIGDERAGTALVEALNDPDDDVVDAALSALHHLDWSAPLSTLQALAGHDSEDVRASAINAMGEHVSEQSLQWITNALEDPSSDVRQAALNALSRLAGKLKRQAPDAQPRPRPAPRPDVDLAIRPRPNARMRFDSALTERTHPRANTLA